MVDSTADSGLADTRSVERAGTCDAVRRGRLPRLPGASVAGLSIIGPGDPRVFEIVGVLRQLRDELVDRLDLQVFINDVVDEHDRRVATGAEAFKLDQREPAVRRRLSEQ